MDNNYPNFSDIFDENGISIFEKEQEIEELEKACNLIMSKNRKLTLLDALELTYNAIEDTKLEECLLKDARRPISYLARRLGLTRQQTCLFATFFGRYEDHNIDMCDVRRHLRCSSIQVLRYKDDVKVLEERGLIMPNNGHSSTWFIPGNIITDVCANKKPKGRKQSKLSAVELMDAIGELCSRRACNDINFDPFCVEVANLMSRNMHVNFCRMVNNYKLGRPSFSLLVWACDMLVNRDDEIICRSDLSNLHEFKLRLKAQYQELVNGESDLFSLGLLERYNGNGFQNKDSWRLTDKAREELLSEFNITLCQSNPYEGLISPDSITKKDLFYNDTEKQQLNRLSELLQDKNYKKVSSRLEKSGMSSGITVLLSGPAGTGKTEFVQQIAKSTGRHIMSVKISDLLNSLVGESEKNVTAMLERYANLVASCPVCPILFLDEIDSIISRRLKNISHSVDKMNNNLQALLLQGLSNFKGILIGTTNLSDNMADEAIERRFLMKIKVEKPTISVRKQIWRSMLPSMSEETLQQVSKEYDFSGGKIANVVRKVLMHDALQDVEADDATILNFCKEEDAGYGKSNPIGF